MRQELLFLLVGLIGMNFIGGGTTEDTSNVCAARLLAQHIQQNNNYTIALEMAHKLLSTFNAGGGYPEVWIRDTNTFLDIALDVVSSNKVKEILLMFLYLQQSNGAIMDGYVIKTNETFKNTVETDQETSLVQAFHQYIRKTNDSNVLKEVINGKTVLERLEFCLNYLLNFKFSDQHKLLFGGTTIDWGDVQPEDIPGTIFNNKTHPAIDIYDNAMFSIAVTNFLQFVEKDPVKHAKWKSILTEWQDNIRSVLWDEPRQKYKPHVYLDRGSPFPSGFREELIYYHGGTAVACQAGLLTPSQILRSYHDMQRNVRLAGGKITIGLSVYPPYPEGFFANPLVRSEYSYQNAGDWSWFGGRMVQCLLEHGFIEEAITALNPMVNRVIAVQDYYEWWTRDNKPAGSNQYHGSAGVIGKAIVLLKQWASRHQTCP